VKLRVEVFLVAHAGLAREAARDLVADPVLAGVNRPARVKEVVAAVAASEASGERSEHKGRVRGVGRLRATERVRNRACAQPSACCATSPAAGGGSGGLPPTTLEQISPLPQQKDTSLLRSLNESVSAAEGYAFYALASLYPPQTLCRSPASAAEEYAFLCSLRSLAPQPASAAEGHSFVAFASLA
jgi:hypothetical protein